MSRYCGGLRVMWHNGYFILQSQQQLSHSSLTKRILITAPEWLREQIPSYLCLDGYLTCDSANKSALVHIVREAERKHILRSVNKRGENREEGITSYSNFSGEGDMTDIFSSIDKFDSSSDTSIHDNTNNSNIEENESLRHIQFVIMDSPDHSLRHLPFLERHAKIVQAVEQTQSTRKQKQHLSNTNVVVSEARWCTGVEDFSLYFEDVTASGGEGVILRNPQTPYLPGLPFMWLKQKVM